MEKKKKSIVFKSFIKECENFLEEEDKISNDEDEDIAFLTKKIEQFLRNRKLRRNFTKKKASIDKEGNKLYVINVRNRDKSNMIALSSKMKDRKRKQ